MTVTLTPYGRNQLRRARPVHAVAVREHLIGRLSDEERDLLLRVARRLNGGRSGARERHD